MLPGPVFCAEVPWRTRKPKTTTPQILQCPSRLHSTRGTWVNELMTRVFDARPERRVKRATKTKEALTPRSRPLQPPNLNTVANFRPLKPRTYLNHQFCGRQNPSSSQPRKCAAGALLSPRVLEVTARRRLTGYLVLQPLQVISRSGGVQRLLGTASAAGHETLLNPLA